MQYLQAMGIDSYVSRHQLPGAAPTRRLALVRKAQVPTGKTPVEQELPRDQVKPPQMPKLDLGADKPANNAAPAAIQTPVTPAVHFSLVAVFCGGIAWVESLGDRPLAKEQVQLVRGMTRAVHGEAGNPRVAQFDWPIHNNPQLDQGEDAAKAGVAAFLLRHIEEQKCRALVILGADCSALVPSAPLNGISRVETLGTAQMLEDPACKRKVWTDLQSIVLRA